MPMVLGSQFRLLIASTIFIIVLQYIHSKIKYFFALLIASTFHLSFIIIFIFPIYIISENLLDLVIPASIIDFYNVKISAYTEQEETKVSIFSIILLTLLLLINTIVLLIHKDLRAILIIVYTLIIPILDSQYWIIYRRAIEVVIFISYPLFSTKNDKISIYLITYFALLYAYIILNIIGYTNKLTFL
jgi:hypothetical protein